MRNAALRCCSIVSFAALVTTFLIGCSRNKKISQELQDYCDFMVRSFEPGSGVEPRDRHLGTWRNRGPSEEAIAAWEEYYDSYTQRIREDKTRVATTAERIKLMTPIVERRGLMMPDCAAMFALEVEREQADLLMNPLIGFCEKYVTYSKANEDVEGQPSSRAESFQSVASAWMEQKHWSTGTNDLIAKLAAMPPRELAEKLKPEFERYLGIHAMPEECATLLSDMEKSLESEP